MDRQIAPQDEVRAHFVDGLIRLSLWYVHKVLREEDVSFAEVVSGRVDIYRNTSLYDGQHHPGRGHRVGPEWHELLARLEAVYARHLHTMSTDKLEEEGMDLLWPYLEGRIGRAPYREPRLEDRPYECWRLDPRDDYINLHVWNLYRPKSPLSEMWIPFSAALIRLLVDARAQYPRIELARCSSWLNSAPRFQELFPPSWLQDAVLRPVPGFTMGYWGQFRDRTGRFHEKNGARFRETGEFPYRSMICSCPAEDILAHLEARFPEAVDYNARRARDR